MICTTFLLFISCCILITPVQAVLSYEPQISYFDGTSYLDNCKSKLERRVTALSGLLISHQLYGSIPYNASKNCFLLIAAPSGYRIRLRVLDFNVLGDAHNCDKDTLHVFDHEKPIDPQTLRDATQEDTSLGPILGQFCGTIRNASELAVSTENALTLWWHTDAELPFHHNGEGFRLLWSAFRKSNIGEFFSKILLNLQRNCTATRYDKLLAIIISAPCNAQREFMCKNQECIAAELACNRYPDCKDESDLIRELQIAHQCDFLTNDPLGSLTGLALLLISMAAVSLSTCLCICACMCCKCMRTPNKACTTAAAEALPIGRTARCTAASTTTLQQPLSPGFYPPSPPVMSPLVEKKFQRKAAMNGVVSGRDLIDQLHYRSNFTIKHGVPYSHLLITASNEYGSTPVQINSDYTFHWCLTSKKPNRDLIFSNRCESFSLIIASSCLWTRYFEFCNFQLSLSLEQKKIGISFGKTKYLSLQSIKPEFIASATVPFYQDIRIILSILFNVSLNSEEKEKEQGQSVCNIR
ncbi:unnamed protein product [Litomosoides sigmodontis]|uniref:CUB domain-containing protein n=1 Tax=Litomosoides sigmodontis TaxID=42156 RepID=A0A3P6SIA3_LITSI|nr:unnamed protein product [Litomosoides sigmodontis]